MMKPTRRRAPLAHGGMSYLEWSDAGVPLHFAHANGFNAETYRVLLAPLADAFHIFACDQRGHGFTDLPATRGLAKGWTVFRDDLIGYLKETGSAPIILAGHSLGATASLMAAAAAPERVLALVLLEPVLVAPTAALQENPGPDLAARALRRRDTFASFEEALESYRGRGIFASWPDKMVEDYLRGGLLRASNGSLKLACAPAWEAEIFREVPLRVAHTAAEVRCPVTIVHGTVNSESEIAALVAARPDARVVRVEGASHFLPMERPDVVREEIRRARERLGA